jgi:hypothetical protein
MPLETTTDCPAAALTDEHGLLLWQTSAYVDDLHGDRRDHAAGLATLLDFLHERLLPYLAAEEADLLTSSLRDRHLARLVLADHERVRAHVRNIESSRTAELADMAANALLLRLERHTWREERWVCG